MKISVPMVALAGLGLIGNAAAAKGKTVIQACVWFSTDISKNFTVNWSAGRSTDACMKKSGTSTSMVVSKQGMTCASLGEVEIDDDGWCYWQQSRWGMAYTAEGKPYSGSTSSRWTTGPVHSDITLVDQSPGTIVCGNQALCSSTSVEWRNDKNGEIFIVVKPGTVGLQTQEL